MTTSLEADELAVGMITCEMFKGQDSLSSTPDQRRASALFRNINAPGVAASGARSRSLPGGSRRFFKPQKRAGIGCVITSRFVIGAARRRIQRHAAEFAVQLFHSPSRRQLLSMFLLRCPERSGHTTRLRRRGDRVKTG